MKPINSLSIRPTLSKFKFSLVESKLWIPTRLAILGGLDSIGCILSLYLTFVMRLESWDIGPYFENFDDISIILVLVCLSVNSFCGIYRTIWRHANLASVARIASSNIFITALFYITIGYLDFSPALPRSFPPIFWLVITMSLCMYKFIWKFIANYSQYTKTSQDRPKCLIYGAGESGRLLAKHIIYSSSSPYELAGFLDDDASLKNRKIEGVKVYLGQDNTSNVIEKLGIDIVIIAIHSVEGHTLRRIHNSVPNKTKTLVMPHLTKSIRTDLSELRPINIRDLLRRNTERYSNSKINSYFYNRSILVTGAGGSIGSELCRQILSTNPNNLILLDICEYNLYKIESELSEQGSSTNIYPILTSVTSKESLNRVFSKFKPSVVIHAAAYKHVPLVEANQEQGIINNVLGTKNVLDCVISHGCKNFMLVSTDKAVNPTNTMGATKRVCELLVLSYQQKFKSSNIQLSLVRFGNVLGSSGSVVPKFIRQIRKGGPVTVTHKDVTRYFMLIDEAVHLILVSLTISNGGEAFILDMGKPIKILDMAKDLISLSGKKVDDIGITFSGLRPGEKLYEELLLEGSETITKYENIFVAKSEEINVEQVLSDISTMIDLAKMSNLDYLRYLSNLGNLVSQDLTRPEHTYQDFPNDETNKYIENELTI